MFVVKCTNCGREQEMKTGTRLSTASIVFAKDSIICDCGNMIEEKEDVLYEGKVED